MKTLVYQSYTSNSLPEHAVVSKERFKAYAERIDADYVCDRFSFNIEKDNIFDLWYNQLTPIFDKKYHDYDKILFVDMDIYPTNDNLKNIFKEKIDSVGMVRDFKNNYFNHRLEFDNDVIIERNKEGWGLFAYKNTGTFFKRNDYGNLNLFNDGVMLVNKNIIRLLYKNINREDIFSYIKKIYKLDDLILNTVFAKPEFFLQFYFLKLGINVTALSDKWNYQRSDYKIYTNKSHSNPYFIHFRTADKKKLTRDFIEDGIKNLYHDKLVIGCGDQPKRGWINSDYLNTGRKDHSPKIKKEGYLFTEINVKEPLPFDSNDLTFIFSEHVLEHLYEKDGKYFLNQAFRTLKPGGVIRTVVPDRNFIESLKDDDEYVLLFSEYLRNKNVISENFVGVSQLVKEWALCERRSDHHWVPTLDMLIKQHEEAGFKVKVCKYFESDHPELKNLEVDDRMRVLESIVVEGTK